MLIDIIVATMYSIIASNKAGRVVGFFVLDVLCQLLFIIINKIVLVFILKFFEFFPLHFRWSTSCGSK